MPTPKPIILPFPVKGLNENSAYGDQPRGTTPAARNVRPYDPIANRARGGQRPGTVKFFDDPVSGTAAVQFIGSMVEAVKLVEGAGFATKIPDASQTIAGVPQDLGSMAWHPSGDYLAFGRGGTSSTLYCYPFDPDTGFGTRATLSTFSNVYTISWHPGGKYIAFGSGTSPYVMVYPFDPDTNTFGSRISVTKTFAAATRVEWSPDGAHLAVGSSTSPYLHVFPFDAEAGTFGTVIEPGTAATSLPWPRWHHAGGVIALGTSSNLKAYSFDGTTLSVVSVSATSHGAATLAWSPDGSAIVYGAASGSGVLAHSLPFDGAAFGVEQAVSDYPSAHIPKGFAWSPDSEFLVVATDSSSYVYTYPYTGSFGTALDAPSPAPAAAAYEVAFHPTGDYVALAWNTSPYFYVYEFHGQLLNPSARKQRVVAVANGNVYRSDYPITRLSVSNSGTSALASTGIIRGAFAYQKMFFCDATAAGYQYLDAGDNTVKDWSAGVTAGALPIGTTDATVGCRIIAHYRGRVVLSGLLEEPQNWFMSKAGDPFNWDYSPATPSATDAVAGNSSDAGLLGDVVTALIPFNDDLMLMGGDHTLWLMRGDPAAGGAIDNVSYQTGVIGPDAWAFDPEGNLYFLGNIGLFRVAAGGAPPELLSQGRLDRALSGIDFTANEVRLAWNRGAQGLHIFITPLTQGSTVHYYWDRRTDSFWSDALPDATGPTAVYVFDGDNPDDRVLLMGGFDSYIRTFDNATKTDDGGAGAATAISSYVDFAPVSPGGDLVDGKLSQLHTILAADSDTVDWSVYAANTAEGAVTASSASVSGTFGAGRNPPSRKTCRGSHFRLRLSSTGVASWYGVERVMGVFTPAGLTRVRRS